MIIKQPNGLYAVWSTVVDSFLLIDATQDDLVEFELERAKSRVIAEIDRIIQDIEAGTRRKLAYTWEEALEVYKEVHGKDFDPEGS